MTSPGAKAQLRMKVFLRKTSTGLLFEEPDQWTEDSRKARSFRHSAEAMDLAKRQRLKGVEILLAFDEPQYTVTISLSN